MATGINILRGTNQGSTGWTNSFGNGSGSVGSCVTDDGINATKIICYEQATSWQCTLFKLGTTALSELKASTDYTISFDINSTYNTQLGISIATGSNQKQLSNRKTFDINKTDEWIHVCVTITTNDLSVGLDNQQIYFSGFNNAGEAIIKNLKMEVGDSETKWIPAPEEGDGVNLIPNSNFYNGTSGWKNTSSISTSVKEDLEHGTYLSLRASANNDFGNCRIYNESFNGGEKFIVGNYYTISFLAKADSSIQVNVGTYSDQQPITVSGGWQTYSVTFKPTQANAFSIGLMSANVDVSVTNIKVEHGKVATSYSLNPSDTVALNASYNILGFGLFTITDCNDAISLSGYITSNLSKYQLYNPDNGTYSPDYTKNNLVLTAQLYVTGTTSNIINTNAVKSIKWYRDNSTTPIVSDSNYSLSGANSSVLTIKNNILNNYGGTTFKCEVQYYDETTDITISHKMSIEVSKLQNGSGIADALATTPNGNIFKNGDVASLTAECFLFRGNTKDTTNVSYQWYKQDPTLEDVNLLSGASDLYDWFTPENAVNKQHDWITINWSTYGLSVGETVYLNFDFAWEGATGLPSNFRLLWENRCYALGDTTATWDSTLSKAVRDVVDITSTVKASESGIYHYSLAYTVTSTDLNQTENFRMRFDYSNGTARYGVKGLTLTKKQNQGGGNGWRKLTDGTNTYSGTTTSTLTIYASEVLDIATFKCLIKDTDVNSSTYNQIFEDMVVLVDLSDPIQCIIESTGGDTFVNGTGSTTLNARLFQNGVEIDVDGKKYTYKWYKYDSKGNLVPNFGGSGINYKTGKKVTISASDVDIRSTFNVEVE